MKKISVSLSGGAAKCAYQGGLLFQLDKFGYEFETIEAISGGVISGHFAALGQAASLEELWLEDIPAWMGKKRWLWEVPLNLIRGRRGLISPEFITGLSDWAITKMPDNLVFYVASLYTAKAHELTGASFQSVEDYRQGLYAACAIPGVFAPVKTLPLRIGVIYEAADAGIVQHVSPVKTDITISTSYPSRSFETTQGPLSILLRSAEIRTNAFRVSNASDMIRPSQEIAGSWNWSRSALKESFDLGAKDAYYVRDLLKKKHGL